MEMIEGVDNKISNHIESWEKNDKMIKFMKNGYFNKSSQPLSQWRCQIQIMMKAYSNLFSSIYKVEFLDNMT